MKEGDCYELRYGDILEIGRAKITISQYTAHESIIEEYKECKLCKLCNTNQSIITTAQCGHAISCKSCLNRLPICPICKFVLTPY